MPIDDRVHPRAALPGSGNNKTARTALWIYIAVEAFRHSRDAVACNML
ncbi:unknown protein [Cronobacter turicensis z3032]|uniref:Uncharacterized protein n=1 Tax=Cronobacter turicensis (strain DSM 18703 / CCUG 55852 / LMG 23827 / z3032) TaxID=693216 RepID=C9Y0D8_CROTZ|nr:unknown protein [Cronobacter turicensis z3032]